MQDSSFKWKSRKQREGVRSFIRALLLSHNNTLTCRQTWTAVATRHFGTHPPLLPSQLASPLDVPSFGQIRVLWTDERNAIRKRLVGAPTGPCSVQYPAGSLTLDVLPTGANRRRFTRRESMRRVGLPIESASLKD